MSAHVLMQSLLKKEKRQTNKQLQKNNNNKKHKTKRYKNRIRRINKHAGFVAVIIVVIVVHVTGFIFQSLTFIFTFTLSDDFL